MVPGRADRPLHISFPRVVPAEVSAQTPRQAPALGTQTPQEGGSPNPRMVDTGRGLWMSPPSTSLARQGHPEPLAQDHVQTALVYPQGGRAHHLPGQPEAVPDRPHRAKTFLVLRQNLLSFILCLLPLLWAHWKEPGSAFFASPSKYLHALMRFPLSPLQAEQAALSLPSQGRCSSTVTSAALHWALSSVSIPLVLGIP